MNTLVKKTDSELKRDVLDELKYEPSVNNTNIGVLVQDGTVTLNGYANSYSEKWKAMAATKRVAGVHGIADDIIIKTPHSLLRTDGDIATAATNQISWLTSVSSGAVLPLVSKGWLTLAGEVDEGYQKCAVEEAVQHLVDVKGITNLLTVKKPALSVADIRDSIKNAFERSGLLDAGKIEIEFDANNKVTLRGHVTNYTERDEAERAAWAAGGVWSVDNQIEVTWAGAF